MMPALSIQNEEAAVAMIRGGFGFVRTTTRLHSGKDNRYDLLHDHDARRKP